ncbi:MAG: hypothetical protein CVU38_13770 [Chloroflexi bacterium HGW-Chloroflexi-1]|nr:MAG: hypothetical protein CVU38_13770 [Chloroflexi bacterium HGW-Chloroflexi-1]
MRILFITGEYPSMQGGVGDYTRQLSRALGALGADVHVLTHADAGGDYLRVPVAAYEPTVYPIMAQTRWQLWGYVMRMIKDLRPHVVHIQYQSAAYGLHPAINYLPRRLRLMRRRPRIVTTFHDLRVPYIFPKAGFLRWQAVLALARGSDASVITNPADWLRLAGANLAPRLLPIPIGSNIWREPPADFDRPRQRARWGAAPDDWLLAYFGFLNPNKGGETLIRALAELVRAGKGAVDRFHLGRGSFGQPAGDRLRGVALSRRRVAAAWELDGGIGARFAHRQHRGVVRGPEGGGAVPVAPRWRERAPGPA